MESERNIGLWKEQEIVKKITTKHNILGRLAKTTLSYLSESWVGGPDDMEIVWHDLGDVWHTLDPQTLKYEGNRLNHHGVML